MKLELFDFIDETIALFEKKQATYEYVQGKLIELYGKMFSGDAKEGISIHSRIKNTDSLKEKLIRNRFYIDYDTPEDAIDHLTDLIGITLQCRFIRNETELYSKLLDRFKKDGGEFSSCIEDDDVFLNLHMPQPQTQRNGFTIYRIDGYCMFNGQKINYELQIKSLVHNFWSDIEHEVVYKNPDFVMYDAFNKEMLGAIRDNLDVVDRQLEIMYNEISYQSQSAQIGMDEKGFKTFVGSSINELVNRKMKESLGFATDFKKCSAILAQFIYVHDFMKGEHNQSTMIDYMELLNFLNDQPIDFKQNIELETPFASSDIFTDMIGKFFIDRLNRDFQWHVFFAMLFTIKPGNNVEDLGNFCAVIKELLIQPSWYENTFSSFKKSERKNTHEMLERTLAEALISIGKIEIIHEEKLYSCMKMFRAEADKLSDKYSSYAEMNRDAARIKAVLYHEIVNLFD
jgi:ppGpp synthetase/RelA/SpoT-type nucleotidyltranferase